MIINLIPFSTFKKCNEFLIKNNLSTEIFLISSTGGYIYKIENSYFDTTGPIDNNLIDMIKPFLERANGRNIKVVK